MTRTAPSPPGLKPPCFLNLIVFPPHVNRDNMLVVKNMVVQGPTQENTSSVASG